jgi:Zn-dependent oligopeptidase
MKFILVVYMCMAGACESVYEQKLYDTKALCEASGAEVKEYAMINFPQSSGEIWCLTEEQFKEYQDHYKTGDDA